MKKIPCLMHEGAFISFILPEKDKIRFICDLCALEFQEQDHLKRFQDLIHIDRALISPIFLISKIIDNQGLKTFFSYLEKANEINQSKQIKEIESYFQQIQNMFLKILQELEQSAKKIIEWKQTIHDELKGIIKFDQFKQILVDLENLGEQINPDAIKQCELQMHQFFENQKNNNQVNQQLLQIYENRYIQNKNSNQFLEFEKFQKNLKQIQLQYDQLTKISFPLIPKESSLFKLDFYFKLQNYIQINMNQKIRKVKLLLEGSRDGMNNVSFWKKCNLKNNLIMIFQSKNGSIFGGYSPCMWQFNIEKYVQDDTLCSFLFSQTLGQIYPLKSDLRSHAIYCSRFLGPTFGGGHDLIIGANFKEGNSQFGHSYECNQNIFGQSKPDIIGCEIYQLIFV